MLRIVSVQPDIFCREDTRANLGGPFCDKCGRGIMRPAGQGCAIAWCYGCGFETGSLPLIDVPLGFGDFADAITFFEAQRIAKAGFDAEADMAERRNNEVWNE